MTSHLGDKLSAYLDGELSGTEKMEATSHLKQCPSCRLELERLRSTSQALKELPRVSLPPRFWEGWFRRRKKQ